MVVLQTAFVLGVLFKLITSVAGIGSTRRRSRQAPAARVPDNELPLYTVLVPVYREANIVAGLIEHLRRLDYPPEKLEVLLLMEEDDDETIAAAPRGRSARHRALHRGPRRRAADQAEAPATSASCFARGEYLVIYDAEDRPEPGPAPRGGGRVPATGADDLVCVQARLNYFNAAENVLTRMFTLEYSLLVRLHAARARRGCGCRSRSAARPTTSAPTGCAALGGWDPFNVTEDADLGMRAAAKGYTVGIIDSTTCEEACSQVVPLDPPAHPLDQGLHADRPRPHPPPGHLHARGGGAQPGRARAADRRHARPPSWRCR